MRKQCIYEKFIPCRGPGCAHSSRTRLRNENIGCMLDLFLEKEPYAEEFERSIQELVREDTFDNQFSLMPIEFVENAIKFWKNLDTDIFFTGFTDANNNPEMRNLLWTYLRKGFELERLVDIPLPKNTDHQIRSSSLYSSCAIQQLLSNLDDRKVAEHFNEKYIENELSRIGTWEHHICLDQGDFPSLFHNNNWSPPGSRNNTEKTILYRQKIYANNYIGVKGHADASWILKRGDHVRAILIYDQKHRMASQTEVPGILWQLLSYAIGISQCLSIDPDFYVLISGKRPFKDPNELNYDLENYRSPVLKFTIIQADRHNEKLREFYEQVYRSYISQSKILYDYDAVMEYKARMEKTKENGCTSCGYNRDRDCFSKQICDLIFANMQPEQLLSTKLLELIGARSPDYHLPV